ncbi:hypothetical protein [Streptomyces sp. NPDC047000]|uniref:hypothetical protein n=1 Tax=Streptomyces sp. NPDC047000 TaxID=3155474 RepID=UPI0033C997DB
MTPPTLPPAPPAAQRPPRLSRVRSRRRLLGLLARRHGAWCTTWTALTGLTALGTVRAYATSYPTAQARHAAVRLNRHGATTLLYGRLRDPGTPGQMFAWEMGTFLTLLASVAAVLLAVRLTRAAEDDGTLETLRACGLRPGDTLRAGLLLMLAAAVSLGAATALGTGVYAGREDGVTWTGALVLGAVVTLTFLLTGTGTAVVAQLVPSAPAARAAGAAGVGLALLVRAAADTGDRPALQWFSPLALRAVAEPFGGDRWTALLPGLLECLALAALALRLQAGRELGASLLRLPARGPRRLHIASATGLAWRRHRAALTAWLASVATGAALLTAMGSGVVTSARRGQLGGGFLADQLGGADPASAFLAYIGTLTGITVSALAILTVLRHVSDEAGGLGEPLRAAGCPPGGPLRAQLTVGLLGAFGVLAATAVAVALAARTALPGADSARDAFTEILAQWPAVAALAGLAALAAGAVPRRAWLAWLPFSAAVAATLLGRLLDLPELLVDLSVFGHTGGGTAPTTGLLPQGTLLALAGLAAAAGLAAVPRRDAALG